jgi:uncharacterized protein (DUF302 family)
LVALTLGTVVALGAVLIESPIRAESPGMIVKQSAHGVDETAKRFEDILLAKGITVFDRVDHAAGATKVGAELPPTQLVVFGNPKLGTPLMQSQREIGIDLPLKALIWEDDSGTVWLGYNDPAYIAERHGVGDRAEVLQTMTGALDNLTSAATKAE